MAYKRGQLPFGEFVKTAKELKRKLDQGSPHYPLIAVARDEAGQELCWARYERPHQREPKVEISPAVDEWNCPVVVVMFCEDQAGLMEHKEFKRVTVGKLVQTSFDDAGWFDNSEEK